MDAVVRAAVIYVFLLLIFRVAGRRTLAQLTGFDFVLLLIVGESTQQALLGDDFSVTNALIVIMTLMTIDVGLSFAKSRMPVMAKVIDGMPMIVVEKGQPLKSRMERARISTDDVLEAARSKRGLERLEQIKYAILEASGGITIIPFGPDGRSRLKRRNRAARKRLPSGPARGKIAYRRLVADRF